MSSDLNILRNSPSWAWNYTNWAAWRCQLKVYVSGSKLTQFIIRMELGQARNCLRCPRKLRTSLCLLAEFPLISFLAISLFAPYVIRTRKEIYLICEYILNRFIISQRGERKQTINKRRSKEIRFEQNNQISSHFILSNRGRRVI